MNRVVGICGVGVMGSAIALRLAEGGMRVLTSDRSARSDTELGQRLSMAGVEYVKSLADVVAASDVLLSVMGSSAATSFAKECAQAVETVHGRGQTSEMVFAECNLISPVDMTQIAVRFDGLGVRVVDAGIVGAPPSDGWSPCVYVAGPYAQELDFLSEHGFDVRRLGDEIGAASALKVCSAAVWQGVLALVSEVMRAGARYGLQHVLAADLRDHQSAIHDWFGPALQDAVPRAARWVPDMDVIARTLRAVGADGTFHEAAARHYRVMSELGTDPDRTTENIVAELAAIGRGDE